MKKLIVTLILLAAFAGAVMAQPDFSKFPDPVKPGNFLLSIETGFGGMGMYQKYAPSLLEQGVYTSNPERLESSAFGLLVKMDYALPIPLTIGIEGGAIYGSEFKYKYKNGNITASVLMIPILARVGWHPNFSIRGLDPYIVAKAGVGIAIKQSSGWSAEAGASEIIEKVALELSSEFCIGFGGDIGVRYFFTRNFGIFLGGDFNWLIPTRNTDADNLSGVIQSLSTQLFVVGVTWKF